jgi:hypothetical protein
LAGWFWRRFMKFFSVFFTLLLLSPLGEGLSPLFEETWIFFPQGRFVLSLFGRNTFLNYPTPFLHFVIIFPLKRAWPFIWINLNSFHPRIKFDLIWTAGSGEDSKNFSVYFHSSLLSPLGERLSPSFEQTWISST